MRNVTILAVLVCCSVYPSDREFDGGYVRLLPSFCATPCSDKQETPGEGKLQNKFIKV